MDFCTICHTDMKTSVMKKTEHIDLRGRYVTVMKDIYVPVGFWRTSEYTEWSTTLEKGFIIFVLETVGNSAKFILGDFIGWCPIFSTKQQYILQLHENQMEAEEIFNEICYPDNLFEEDSDMFEDDSEYFQDTYGYWSTYYELYKHDDMFFEEYGDYGDCDWYVVKSEKRKKKSKSISTKERTSRKKKVDHSRRKRKWKEQGNRKRMQICEKMADYR
jgi:hypothetical protein